MIRAAQAAAELLVDRLVARALDAAEFECAAVRLRFGQAWPLAIAATASQPPTAKRRAGRIKGLLQSERAASKQDHRRHTSSRRPRVSLRGARLRLWHDRRDAARPDLQPRSLRRRPRSALLRDVFGYAEFRGQQDAIIAAALAGRDSLVLMPTGGGKSLCYQIPALLRDGVAIVVSPLIALMEDQVGALREAGVRAAFLNSSLAPRRADDVDRDAAPAAGAALRRARAAAAGRDAELLREVHRADRDRRGALRLAMGPRLSAGLSRPGRAQDGFRACRAWRSPRPRRRDARARSSRGSSSRRRDVFVERLRPAEHPLRGAREDRARAAAARVPRHAHAARRGIVYCLSRDKNARASPSWLARAGLDALPYHAGLRAETRARNQDASSRRRRWSSSRRSRSAWASTSPTCGSSRTSTCRRASRPTTRKRAAPVATACPRTHGWSTACRTSCSCAS